MRHFYDRANGKLYMKAICGFSGAEDNLNGRLCDKCVQIIKERTEKTINGNRGR